MQYAYTSGAMPSSHSTKLGSCIGPIKARGNPVKHFGQIISSIFSPGQGLIMRRYCHCLSMKLCQDWIHWGLVGSFSSSFIEVKACIKQCLHTVSLGSSRSLSIYNSMHLHRCQVLCEIEDVLPLEHELITVKMILIEMRLFFFLMIHSITN